MLSQKLLFISSHLFLKVRPANEEHIAVDVQQGLPFLQLFCVHRRMEEICVVTLTKLHVAHFNKLCFRFVYKLGAVCELQRFLS